MEFRKPRNEEERERFVQEMIDRPADVRRELIKKLKRDNPDITDKELATELAIVEATLGF